MFVAVSFLATELVISGNMGAPEGTDFTAWSPQGSLLSLDSTLGPGSAALALEGRVVASLRADGDGRGMLPRLVEALLQQCDRTLGDVDAFVVAAGPGRFTGVRSALSVAKGLAWALKKPLVTIGSLEALGCLQEPLVVLGDGPRALYVAGLALPGERIVYAWEISDFIQYYADSAPRVSRIVGTMLGPVRGAFEAAGFVAEWADVTLDAERHMLAAIEHGVGCNVHDAEPRYVREPSITPPRVAPPRLSFADA